jgi:hypothetical protein
MTDGQTGATSIAILALAVLRDRVVFGVQTPTGGTSFLIADSANVRAVGRTKIQSPASLVVSRMAPCPDGGLLALGTAGGRAWIAKLDPSGSVSWQRTLTDTEATAIADGVQLLDGTIVLLGAAAPTGSGSASAPTWVGRLSGKGDLLAQANLQMTGVGIAAFRDGRVAVLEEKSASIGKDISVRFLDAGLSERQNLALASGVKGAFPFRMASFGDDAIVLGYTKEFVPWAAQVTADAQLGWTETRPYDAKQVPVVGRLDVLADTTGAVALFTLAVVDDKGEQRQTVRVVKYDAVTKR